MCSTCLQEVSFHTYHRSGSHLCHHPEPPTHHFVKEPAGTLEHQGVLFSSAPSTWLWPELLAHLRSYKTPLSGCCGSASCAGLRCYRGTGRDTRSLLKFIFNNLFVCVPAVMSWFTRSFFFFFYSQAFNFMWNMSSGQCTIWSKASQSVTLHSWATLNSESWRSTSTK